MRAPTARRLWGDGEDGFGGGGRRETVDRDVLRAVSLAQVNVIPGEVIETVKKALRLQVVLGAGGPSLVSRRAARLPAAGSAS